MSGLVSRNARSWPRQGYRARWLTAQPSRKSTRRSTPSGHEMRSQISIGGYAIGTLQLHRMPRFMLEAPASCPLSSQGPCRSRPKVMASYLHNDRMDTCMGRDAAPRGKGSRCPTSECMSVLGTRQIRAQSGKWLCKEMPRR